MEGSSEKKSKTTDDIDGDGRRRGQRKTMSARCGCNAKLALKYMGKAGFSVYLFVEEHNHSLVNVRARKFLKASREMTYVHKSFAFDAAKVKIGPSQAHQFLKELVGGYGSVGPTEREFWNRDLKHGIGDRDVQIILDKFKVKKENSSAYHYEYEVDSDGRLTKLFWSDPIGRRNYEVFGDVISFDATYGMNMFFI